MKNDKRLDDLTVEKASQEAIDEALGKVSGLSREDAALTPTERKIRELQKKQENEKNKSTLPIQYLR